VKSKATTKELKMRMRLQDYVEKWNGMVINSNMREEKWITNLTMT